MRFKFPVNWEGFTDEQESELRRLWVVPPLAPQFGSYFVTTVSKSAQGKPGMLSIEATDLDLFRGYFSVLIVDDSDPSALVQFVKSVVSRFWTSFQHRNRLGFARARMFDTSARDSEISYFCQIRVAEEILLAEYNQAEAAFDRAKGTMQTGREGREACERYIEATRRLRKFLERGEVPNDIERRIEWRTLVALRTPAC